MGGKWAEKTYWQKSTRTGHWKNTKMHCEQMTQNLNLDVLVVIECIWEGSLKKDLTMNMCYQKLSMVVGLLCYGSVFDER